MGKSILIITYNDYPVYEGLGVRIKNIARLLVESGHDVTIFAPNLDNKRPKVEELNGCRIVRCNIFVPTRIKNNRVAARAISMVIQSILTPFVCLRHLRGETIDLTMAEHIYSVPSALVVKLLKGARVFVDDIITVADVLGESGYTILVKPFTMFERILFKFCDDFVYTSPVSYDYYKARGSSPTIYAPNGVDCDEFRPVKNSNKKTTILFNCSAYSPQNNAAATNFIRIGQALNSEAPGRFEFRLISWPFHGLSVDVQRAVKAGIDWLSYMEGVEQIGDEIVKADITILPYNKEHKLTGGVRLKALEYMACGALVISTFEGIAGIRGLTDRKHFLLAENVEQIPELIHYAVSHPEEMRTMRANAREFVLTHFDWRKTSKELVDRIA